ncbi:S8 family peptidase [Nonomuraea wenchangensis]|uniref:S8 family peptidase n=1 Tax=Nonomuraea wenchangensis TaxID=568860 RepID=UPI00384A61DB
MRLRSLLASASVLAFTTTGALIAAPAHAAAGDPEIAKNVTAEVRGGHKVRAVIELKKGQSVDAVAADAEKASKGTQVVDKKLSDDFLVATLDKATLEEVRTDDRVAAVYEDRLSVATLDVSTKLIGADKANAAGWTGKGSTIAVLDTGIDRDHPFFAGRIVGEACFSATSTDPYYGAKPLCPNGQSVQTGAGAADAETAACVVNGANQCYHGTHVAGIAAGKKAAGAPSNGVAPEAGILPIQVFTRLDGPVCQEELGRAAPCFATFVSAQKAALQYVDSVHAGKNVIAVNMSLGGGAKQTKHCDADPSAGALKDEIVWLKQFGVSVVVAAGNEGFTDGVSSPACVSAAVAVGATDDQDAVAAFSNRGALLDLFAPGVQINSAVPGGGYRVLNGTSMAAPHVAGALALVRQAYPQLSGEGRIAKLQDTGKAITYGGVTTKRIDLTAALPPKTSPSPTPTPTGSPTPAPTGTHTPGPSPTATPTPTPTTSPEDGHRNVDPGIYGDPQPVPDTCSRGRGGKPLSAKAWATEMLRGKGSLSDDTLRCYLTLAQNGSKVFPELTGAGTLGKAYKVLATKSKAAKALLDRELLAAWLNYAHGVYDSSAKVHGRTTLKQAVAAAERHRAGKSAAAMKKAALYLYRHVNK